MVQTDILSFLDELVEFRRNEYGSDYILCRCRTAQMMWRPRKDCPKCRGTGIRAVETVETDLI